MKPKFKVGDKIARVVLDNRIIYGIIEGRTATHYGINWPQQYPFLCYEHIVATDESATLVIDTEDIWQKVLNEA